MGGVDKNLILYNICWLRENSNVNHIIIYRSDHIIINNSGLVNLLYLLYTFTYMCIWYTYTYIHKKKIPILYLKHILLKSFRLIKAFSLLVRMEEVKNYQKSKNFA